MKIEINWKNSNNMFVLPEMLVTKYINSVEYDFLKVILYIFVNKNENLSTKNISNFTKVNNDNVIDILRFWHNEGFIIYNEELEINKVDNKDLLLSKGEYSDIISVDDNVKFLLKQVEFILKRNIIHSECKIFVSIYKMYGMPVDVILMLTQYCVNCGKDNIAYIKKVAVSWCELGVNSLEKAEQHIMTLEQTDKDESYIKNTFGITSRNLTQKEKVMTTKWLNEIKVSDELLKEAYNRCVDNIGKISFSYINKILVGWNEKGYKTLESVLLYEKNRSSKSFINKDIEDFDKDIGNIYNEV